MKALIIPITIQIIFLILKIFKIIKWKWFIVLFPLWATIGFIILAVIIQKLVDWKDGY